MSKLLRCNRCGQDQELREVIGEDNGLVKMTSAMGAAADLKGWAQIKVAAFGFPLKPPVKSFDLCPDCREVFLLQFMEAAEVAAITQPPGQNVLPHDNVPFQDCLLAFDPEKGGFICEHDDPERFLWLQRNRAQNVAEGVPERKICSECGCVAHREFGPCSSTGCQCMVGLTEKIDQVVADVKTAGYAHSVVQRCSEACHEAHTYVAGCLLAGVVQPPVIQPGRLISQHGEDLTEAYSPQEPAHE